jgi:hypothetical protein
MQMRYALTWTPMVDGEVKPWGRCDASGNLLVNLAAGSVSAGTEYTEDAASVANPSGSAVILVRRDTLSASEVSADGDNVAAKATSKGEQYVHDSDVLAQLVTLAGYLDGLEGFSDGIEGLITSTNTLLTTQAGYVDGLETLLTTQAGYLDGVEGQLGIATETAPASDTASSGLNGRLQRVAQRLTSLIALLPTALGSAAAASSLAVTASTEDIARQGIVTETAPASDTASSGQNGRLQRIAQRITSLIALLPASLGAKAAASSLAVTNSTEDAAAVGATNETAAASDTATAGLNGRLQRIAQRITSLIAQIPASLGTKSASASLSVTQAGLEYETVAASQTAQALGATGATGDYLSHIIIQPATTGAGTVTVLDNATVIYTFTSGTLADLRPIIVPFNLFSVSGAWKVTTGTNVAVIGIGDFT